MDETERMIAGLEALEAMQDINPPYVVKDEGRAVVLLDLTDSKQRRMYDIMRNYILNERLRRGL